MCWPAVAGPSKRPINGILSTKILPGISSEMWTSILAVGSIAYFPLKMSTLWTVTLLPKSRAIQGEGSSSERQSLMDLRVLYTNIANP